MKMIGKKFRFKSTGEIFEIYAEAPPNVDWDYVSVSSDGTGHDCGGLIPKYVRGWYLVDRKGSNSQYNINNEEYWEKIETDFWNL